MHNAARSGAKLILAVTLLPAKNGASKANITPLWFTSYGVRQILKKLWLMELFIEQSNAGK
jgi:hypothetical protein